MTTETLTRPTETTTTSDARPIEIKTTREANLVMRALGLSAAKGKLDMNTPAARAVLAEVRTIVDTQILLEGPPLSEVRAQNNGLSDAEKFRILTGQNAASVDAQETGLNLTNKEVIDQLEAETQQQAAERAQVEAEAAHQPLEISADHAGIVVNALTYYAQAAPVPAADLEAQLFLTEHNMTFSPVDLTKH